MATLLPFRGVWPQLDETVFLADGARVIGDVHIGAHASVWFNAVVRGDVCPVRIGARTNVQDNVTLHVTHDTGPLTIGERVTIGHNAVLHACTVKERVLIGMGAIVLDGAVLEPHTLVAAGALLRPGFTAPPGMLVAGVPAVVKRPLTDAERAFLDVSAENYVRYVAAYRAGGYTGAPPQSPDLGLAGANRGD
ncbi:gamma carbonic anhydrase family protein [Botrimarina hoheduenensis]|uniref:Maltose O-acetyltransferase n=1 Tax=Botrimarina hoheduenensis TaxID=2528000 RepID=A0A5C5WAP0_9BACT|nr:gamma carbonic anhydrase family protein [Botrimarina hoheduenensis]TWT47750.1 maltose O-acetyltransferase [Botrimarina hoheduenensis]